MPQHYEDPRLTRARSRSVARRVRPASWVQDEIETRRAAGPRLTAGRDRQEAAAAPPLQMPVDPNPAVDPRLQRAQARGRATQNRLRETLKAATPAVPLVEAEDVLRLPERDAFERGTRGGLGLGLMDDDEMALRSPLGVKEPVGIGDRLAYGAGYLLGSVPQAAATGVGTMAALGKVGVTKGVPAAVRGAAKYLSRAPTSRVQSVAQNVTAGLGYSATSEPFRELPEGRSRGESVALNTGIGAVIDAAIGAATHGLARGIPSPGTKSRRAQLDLAPGEPPRAGGGFDDVPEASYYEILDGERITGQPEGRIGPVPEPTTLQIPQRTGGPTIGRGEVSTRQLERVGMSERPFLSQPTGEVRPSRVPSTEPAPAPLQIPSRTGGPTIARGEIADPGFVEAAPYRREGAPIMARIPEPGARRPATTATPAAEQPGPGSIGPEVRTDPELTPVVDVDPAPSNMLEEFPVLGGLAKNKREGVILELEAIQSKGDVMVAALRVKELGLSPNENNVVQDVLQEIQSRLPAAEPRRTPPRPDPTSRKAPEPENEQRAVIRQLEEHKARGGEPPELPSETDESLIAGYRALVAGDNPARLAEVGAKMEERGFGGMAKNIREGVEHTTVGTEVEAPKVSDEITSTSDDRYEVQGGPEGIRIYDHYGASQENLSDFVQVEETRGGKMVPEVFANRDAADAWIEETMPNIRHADEQVQKRKAREARTSPPGRIGEPAARVPVERPDIRITPDGPEMPQEVRNYARERLGSKRVSDMTPDELADHNKLIETVDQEIKDKFGIDPAATPAARGAAAGNEVLAELESHPEPTAIKAAERAPEEAPVGVRITGGDGDKADVVFSSGKRLETQGRVVDANELTPSHSPEGWKQNEGYPAEVQNRQYHLNKTDQQQFEKRVKGFDVARALDSTAEIGSGVPTVRGDGVVIAGNERTMMLQRLAAREPEKYAAYRTAMEARAQEVGIDTAALEGMENPVLVRELTDASVDLNDRAVLRDLNQQSDVAVTKGKDAVSDASSRARKLEDNPESLEHLSNTFGDEQTLNDYLGTPEGRDFVDLLESTGVIESGELATFRDPKTRTLNEDGTTMVVRTLQMAAIGDPELVSLARQNLAAIVGGKKGGTMEHAFPAIVRASSIEGWDQRGTIQGALRLNLEKAANRDIKTVYDLVEGQRSLLPRDDDPTAVVLAEFLDQSTKLETKVAFHSYAKEAAIANNAGQYADDMFGFKPKTPAEAFDDAFGGVARMNRSKQKPCR